MARLLRTLGSFCARHGLLVIGIWVLLGLGVGVAVATYGAQTNNDLSLPGTGSQAAKDLLEERFPPQQNGVNPIVFDVSTGKLTDDANKQAVVDSIKAIKAVPHVYSVTNPLSSTGQTAGLLAKDGQTAFAPVLLDIGSGDLTPELAQEVLDATKPADDAGITVAAAGSIGSTLSTDDSEISEVVGIVAAMIILTLVLGSLVAMGMPIITAVVGLGVALGVIGLLGHVVTIPSSGPTLATMIGLGVGIDYALFLITRHQEHLRSGMSPSTRSPRRSRPRAARSSSPAARSSSRCCRSGWPASPSSARSGWPPRSRSSPRCSSRSPCSPPSWACSGTASPGSRCRPSCGRGRAGRPASGAAGPASCTAAPASSPWCRWRPWCR